MTAVPLAGPSEFVGHWIGLADQQVAFTVDIALNDEELEAVLNAPDQGFIDLASNWTKLSGDHELQMSFTLQNDLKLVVDGALQDDGDFIGTYEMGEQAGLLTMTKKEE